MLRNSTTQRDVTEAAALDSDPELKDLWQRMLQDYSLSDEFYRRLNERIADSLQRWLDLVSMASIQGVLGERGKAWGHDIKNVGRQILED